MSVNAIVDIDIFKSTLLKDGKPQDENEKTFSSYHSLIKQIFEDYGGEIWHQMGDGTICIFQSPIKAVDACLQLLQELFEFNEQHESQLHDTPLFPRIGIHTIRKDEIANVQKNDRGTFAHRALDVAGKLQKNCPICKITISPEVYESLGFKQRLFRPSLVETSGNISFVLMDRLIAPQEEKLLYGLSLTQKKSIPPIPFLGWNTILPDEGLNLMTLNDFFDKPLLMILGETSSSSRGSISSAATSDAVGIMEVMAALKSNQQVRVGIDQWEDTADIVYDRNIVIIGSGIVNIYAFALNDVIYPIHFVKTGGRVFDQLIANSEEGQIYFGPHAVPPRDTGLVIISKSPFNLEKSLLWVAGITGMGTQAVANFLKDLILDAGSAFRRLGIANTTNPIACAIGAETRVSGNEWKLSDYHGRLRILDYRILWMVDRNGKKII